VAPAKLLLGVVLEHDGAVVDNADFFLDIHRSGTVGSNSAQDGRLVFRPFRGPVRHIKCYPRGLRGRSLYSESSVWSLDNRGKQRLPNMCSHIKEKLPWVAMHQLVADSVGCS
jgi:hypothetical protein